MKPQNVTTGEPNYYALFVTAFVMCGAIFYAFGYAHERDAIIRHYTSQESLEYMCEKYTALDCRVDHTGKIYIVRNKQ